MKRNAAMSGHHSASSKTNEWFTPPEIITALGPFDLDPCAPKVQPFPTAARTYTREDNGLIKSWTWAAIMRDVGECRCGQIKESNVPISLKKTDLASLSDGVGASGVNTVSRPQSKTLGKEIGENIGRVGVGNAQERKRVFAPKKRRQENPETVREQKRRHRRTEKGIEWRRKRTAIDNHARRQRQRGRPFQWSDDDWKRTVAFFSGSCAYCDALDRRLTQDHFIPINSPGFPGTIPGNIVPACQPCNSAKGDRDPILWVSDESRRNRILLFLLGEKSRAGTEITKGVS